VTTNNTPYLVEIWLRRTEGEAVPPGLHDVDLFDRERSGVQASGVANLRLGDDEVPGLGMSGAQFLAVFHRGDAGSPDDGLLFGRYLLRRILAEAEVARLWAQIQERRDSRPLRMELVLPTEDVRGVAEIPFELLADDRGFLFQSFGASLVRAIQDLPARTVDLPRDASILVAWANPTPPGDTPLPADLLKHHEEKTAAAARRLGFQVKDPCRQASRRSLEGRLVSERPVEIVSLVAHGDPAGGAVWLHDEDHPKFPADPGTPTSAGELAKGLRKGEVEVALLWTCHGARRHPIAGAVAARLLHPDGGNLSAVVTAHAALRAEGTERIVEALLEGLRGAAAGDLERAVGEGRSARSDSDLQWAAPVYYARPRGGRTVTLEQAIEEEVASWRTPPPAPGTVQFEGAPPPWEHFRGRTDEIARGLALLRQGRLVSVTGMPGIGKTEVALEIARRALADQALGFERALWVPLDEMSDADALRARLALELGADPERYNTAAALARYIGGQRLLVVLDNAEDLIRADRAGFQELTEALLRGASGVRFVLATREILGELRATTEQELPLGRLPKEAAREAFSSAAGPRLTTEALGSEELGKLLVWLDGHPLSLMLVARRVGELPLAELRQRLESNALELVGAAEYEDDDRTRDAKLRTKRLESSLNLSYLPLRERHPVAAEMFAWLSNFPAGLPRVLAKAVFGPEAERWMGLLRRANLALEEQGADRRLELPAPVRSYAARQAATIPAERRMELLTASFAALAGWLEALYRRLGKPGARDAMIRGGREEANLHALGDAMSKLPLPEADSAPAAALAGGATSTFTRFAVLMKFAGRSRRAVDIGERLRSSVERLARRPPPAIDGALGDLYLHIDRIQEAEAAYLRALTIFNVIGSRLGEANTERALGHLHSRTARFKEAEAAYLRALTIFRVIGSRLDEANTERALGHIYLRTSRLNEAEAAYMHARPVLRELGERLEEANTERALGDIYLRTSRLSEAEVTYLRALTVFRDIDEPFGTANTERALGDLYLRTSRLGEAETAYRRAVTIFRNIDLRVGEANTEKTLGDLYLRTARLKAAEAAYQRALTIFRDIDEPLGKASTENALGSLYLRNARLKEAEAAYQRALATFRNIDAPLDQAKTEQALGEVYMYTGRLEEAEAAYLRALTTFRKVDERLSEASIEQALGDIHMHTGRIEEAEAAYLRATNIFNKSDEPLGEANILERKNGRYRPHDHRTGGGFCPLPRSSQPTP